MAGQRQRWASAPTLQNRGAGQAAEAPAGSRDDPRVARWAVAALLVLHAVLLAWAAARSSVAYDEYAHLPAGVAYWKYGELSIYNQSPPLLRWWGALPAVLAGAAAPDPAPARKLPADVRYWAYGQAFLSANFERYQSYFFLCRLGLIPLSCLGAWIVYRFAAELYGSTAGIAACALYALCPNIAAQASLVGTDAGSAVAMLAAIWLWQRFCRRPIMSRALLAALAIVLAHLCKFYAVLLWPMAAVVAAWYAIFPAPARWRDKLPRLLGGLIACGAATLLVVNLAYGLVGTFRPLSSYSFEGTTLRVVAATLPGRTPVPLPAAFVEGFDAAQAEVQTLFPGYLLGEAYRGARWNYYPIALACKLPLATLILLFAAVASGAVSIVRRLRRGASRAGDGRNWDEAPVFLTLAAFVTGFALMAKINIGIRYLLPAFPLAFILAGRLWTWKPTRVAGWALLAALLAENLGTAPRYLSFYNVAAGRGYPIVNDFDWGQSLIDLRDWMHANGIPRIRLAYNGRVDPHVYGIDYVPLVQDCDIPIIAISGYYLTGQPRPMATPQGLSPFIAIPFNRELMDRPPLAVLGSILIYQRTDLEAAQREWQRNRSGSGR